MALFNAGRSAVFFKLTDIVYLFLSGEKMKTLMIALLITLSAGCASVNSQKFEGYYSYGHEVSEFKRCNDSKVYWLNGDNLTTIEQASLSLAKIKNKPYQPVYIIFSGFFDQREAIAFEKKYDGLIYLDQLLSHTNKAPSSCHGK